MGVIQLSLVIVQLTVWDSFVVWILGESRTSTGMTFSWSVSLVEASRVSESTSAFHDLGI